jgi:hypothetical protein
VRGMHAAVELARNALLQRRRKAEVIHVDVCEGVCGRGVVNVTLDEVHSGVQRGVLEGGAVGYKVYIYIYMCVCVCVCVCV